MISFFFLLSFFVVFLSHINDSDPNTQGDVEQLLNGIYSITVEGGDATTPLANGGIVIEGVEVLHELGDVATACALLMDVIYAQNLSYPQKLKATFEVLRRSFFNWMLQDSQQRYRFSKTNCLNEPPIGFPIEGLAE